MTKQAEPALSPLPSLSQFKLACAYVREATCCFVVLGNCVWWYTAVLSERTRGCVCRECIEAPAFPGSPCSQAQKQSALLSRKFKMCCLLPVTELGDLVCLTHLRG